MSQKKLTKLVQFFIFNFIIVFTSCNGTIEDDSPENIDNQSIINPDSFYLESNIEKGQILTVNFMEKPLEVEKVNDQFIFEGDIIIIPDDKNSTKTTANKSVGRTTARWENNTVYYEIEDTVDLQYRIFDAIEHWEQNTSLRFYPKEFMKLDML